MKNTHSGLKVLALFLFIGILCSLFFPYYRSWVANLEFSRHQFGLLSMTLEPEIGYVKIISGFGSIFGISNTIFQFFLLYSLFFLPKRPAIPITISSIYTASLVLIWLGTQVPSGGPIADSMLFGFYLSLPFSIANIIISYFVAYKTPRKTFPENLLDDVE